MEKRAVWGEFVAEYVHAAPPPLLAMCPAHTLALLCCSCMGRLKTALEADGKSDDVTTAAAAATAAGAGAGAGAGADGDAAASPSESVGTPRHSIRTVLRLVHNVLAEIKKAGTREEVGQITLLAYYEGEHTVAHDFVIKVGMSRCLGEVRREAGSFLRVHPTCIRMETMG